MERRANMILRHDIKHRTLYEAFFSYRNTLIDILMILLSVVFLAVTANITIPLWPVPITMQTFGVFAIAFFFGYKKGFLSILSYIAVGVMGFGVFAGYKSGIGAVLGPTGGYIIGFAAMVLLVGYLIEKGFGRTRKSVLFCLIAGEAVLYLCGLIGLRIFLGNVSFVQLLSVGLLPFIIGDIIKIAAAVELFPLLWKGSEKIIR